MSTTVGNWINENTPGFNDRPKPANNPLIADGTDYRDEYFQENLFLLHDIGLKQNEETKLPGFMSGTIAGDSWEAYANLRNGKTFESIMGGLAVASTVADAIYDPFGFVGDQIAGWMVTHLEPYRKLLDGFAGNDAMVQAYADSWKNIATGLTKMSDDWSKSIEQDISTWTGAAGDAYRQRAADLVDQVSGTGGVAASIGEAMDLTAKIVKAFRKLIQDIVTSLVGALIGYSLEIAVSFGSATPHVITAVMARFARDCFKITTLLSEMVKDLRDVEALTEAVVSVIYAVLGKENQPASV